MGQGIETLATHKSREKELNVLIGENIKVLRQQQKKKQIDVETDLHLTLHAVSKFERGESGFTPDIIEMFANYYNVPAWLLTYDKSAGVEWYDVYDQALYRLISELPSDVKLLYAAMIMKDWQQSHPKEKLEDRLDGKMLEYLKTFRKIAEDSE